MGHPDAVLVLKAWSRESSWVLALCGRASVHKQRPLVRVHPQLEQKAQNWKGHKRKLRFGTRWQRQSPWTELGRGYWWKYGTVAAAVDRILEMTVPGRVELSWDHGTMEQPVWHEKDITGEIEPFEAQRVVNGSQMPRTEHFKCFNFTFTLIL